MTDYSGYLSASPPTDATSDDLAYNLGTAFKVTSSAWFKGGKFWQPSANSPSDLPRIVQLWQVDSESTGTLVWQRESSLPVAGWNSVLHSAPPLLTINQDYKVVTQHLAGRYAATAGYFSTGDGSDNLVNGPLTIYNSGNSISGQGTYNQTSSLLFPFTEAGSANYWNDVIITDVDPNVSGSVADTARANMLSALSLTEPQLYSNVDLMRMVLETPGQVLVTETEASAATHYQRYIDGLA